jgi:hypothetical protein
MLGRFPALGFGGMAWPSHRSGPQHQHDQACVARSPYAHSPKAAHLGRVDLGMSCSRLLKT